MDALSDGELTLGQNLYWVKCSWGVKTRWGGYLLGASVSGAGAKHPLGEMSLGIRSMGRNFHVSFLGGSCHGAHCQEAVSWKEV